MIHNTDTVESMLTMKERVPKGRYTCRILKSKYEPSKSKDNPMVTIEAELCLDETGSETVTVNGAKKVIAGVETSPLYFPLIVLNEETKERDTERSLKSYKRYQDFLVKLGFNAEAKALDDESPFIPSNGFVFDALCGPDESAARKDPTPEQLAKGQKFGDPIKDAHGHEIKYFRVKINDVLGASNVEIARPF